MKPVIASGYEAEVTRACERILVTLLRGLGPYKESIYLVGGLTPRYLAPEAAGFPHAGTGDVDVVIDNAILANVEAYRSLEDNLRSMGFEQFEANGRKVAWRWVIKIEPRMTLYLELLADGPDHAGGKPRALAGEDATQALSIPHAVIVHDLFDRVEIEAELLNGDGLAREWVRYANIVAFTCLKAFAMAHRNERKDPHDIVYCLESFPGGLPAVAEQFQTALRGTHREAIEEALEILRRDFCSDERTEGYRKAGPTKAANFEFDIENAEAERDSEMRDAKILRQREISELITNLLGQIV